MKLTVSDQRKLGTLLSYVSIGVSYLVAILFTPIMLRLLGKNEYGLYTVSSSVINYLNLLSFGMGASYVRFYVRYKNENEKKVESLNAMYLLVFTVVGLLSVLIGVVLVKNVGYFFGNTFTYDEVSRAQMIMEILVINIAISFPASVFSSYLNANEQFVLLRLGNIVKQVLNPLLVLPLLLSGHTSVSMAVVALVINVSTDIVYMFFSVKKLKMSFSKERMDIKFFWEIFSFSFFIFLNSIVNEINWNLDKFLLGIFHGTAAVAVYGIAAQINNCYMSFSTAISNVFVPRVNQIITKEQDNNELNRLFIKISRMQFIILALIIIELVFIGRPFIWLWAGRDYDNAYFIILILAIFELIPLTQNLGIEIQRAKNKHQFRVILYLFIAVFNLLISIPLGKKWEGIGCAIGTAFGQLVGNTVFMNWYYSKKLKIDIKRYYKNMAQLLPALMPVIAGGIILLKLPISGLPGIIVAGSILFLIYMVSMWKMVLNRDEKDLVLHILRDKIQ